MIHYFTLKNGIVQQAHGTNFDKNSVIWVDLLSATENEKKHVEKVFNVELFTKQESEEIETSSKYFETADEIGINLHYLSYDFETYQNEVVSFIIKDKILITQRDAQLRTFDETAKKVKLGKPQDGDDIFLLLLDARIDYDADLLEIVTANIGTLSKEIYKAKHLHRDILLRIAKLQDTTIVIRDNVIEKQRVLSAMLKSKKFPKEDLDKILIMNTDISSLLEHSGFSFDRLEFLQSTFLGLVDMEQNRVMKFFTVMTVIFMPPTLIAGTYGMNFKFMPELGKTWGYPFALGLMILSVSTILFFFKRKKWL